MHLGLICNEYPPTPHGGIGSFSQDLAEGMVAAGHRVTVIGFYPAAPPVARKEIKGLEFVSLSPSRLFRWYRPHQVFERWRLKRALRAIHARNPFHVLNVPDYEGWLPRGVVPNLPVIVSLHGSNLFFDSELGRTGNPFEHDLERKTLLRADYWLGFSRYAFSRTLNHCGIKDHAGEIISHAVDTRLFCPGSEPMESGLIVFVNTINAKKGVEQLIDAANLVFSSHTNARLVLIGGGKADYLQMMRERVKPEFSSRVVFAGRLPRAEVIPWLQRANVCCYPSHMETFGIAPVEAMSVGKATIYSRTGPGPEVIEDGISGLLCDPSDPQNIAERIMSVLSQPARATEIGAAARQRVLKLFNKEDWIGKQLAFYQNCLKRKHR